MVVTLLVAASVLALLHLYYFGGKAGKADYIYFIVLLAVMGANSQNADYTAYEDMYQKVCDANAFSEVLSVHSDKGYTVLMWVLSTLGFDYVVFRFTLFALLLGITFMLAKKLDTPVCVLYLSYTVFPMFMDVIQIRNYIISVLFLASVYCYAHTDFKWDIAGILLMLIAITIQPLAIIYALFIVFYKLYRSEHYRVITYVPIGLGVLSPIINASIIYDYWEDITAFLYKLTSVASRGADYVDDMLLPSMHFKIYFVVIVLAYLLYKAQKKIITLECVNDVQKKFVELSFVAYLYIICWAPFWGINYNFATRLPRNLFLLAFISLGLYIKECVTLKKKMMLLSFIAFLAFFFGLVDLYVSFLRFNVGIIIENNFILE